MLHKILAVNSGLLVLSTVFLVFAIGRAILTWNGTVLAYAVAIFLILLIIEIALSFYSS